MSLCKLTIYIWNKQLLCKIKPVTISNILIRAVLFSTNHMSSVLKRYQKHAVTLSETESTPDATYYWNSLWIIFVKSARGVKIIL